MRQAEFARLEYLRHIGILQFIGIVVENKFKSDLMTPQFLLYVRNTVGEGFHRQNVYRVESLNARFHEIPDSMRRSAVIRKSETAYCEI